MRLLLPLVLLACAGPPDAHKDGHLETGDDTAVEDFCVDQPEVTWDAWGQGFFRSYCTACHSRQATDRRGAPASIHFDTEADARQFRLQIQTSVIDNGTMPVGGGVVAEDLMLLQVLLRCGL